MIINVDGLTVVMITCQQREPTYLHDTLASLRKATYTSLGLSFTIFNDIKRLANRNASDALEFASGIQRPWVLFLEDDIQVCARFFDSVSAWLTRWQSPEYRIYSFGCAYPEVSERIPGRESWPYPIDQFYGTQAFAIRREDAATLAEYLATTDDPPGQYDLSMHKWARKFYPSLNYFLASVPSFVQHIGTVSSIRPDEPSFTFQSFPGEDWSYVKDGAK